MFTLLLHICIQTNPFIFFSDWIRETEQCN